MTVNTLQRLIEMAFLECKIDRCFFLSSRNSERSRLWGGLRNGFVINLLLNLHYEITKEELYFSGRIPDFMSSERFKIFLDRDDGVRSV